MKWLLTKHNSRIYATLRNALVILVIVAIVCTTFVSYYVNLRSVLDTAWQNDWQLLQMHSGLMKSMKELAFQIGHQIYADNQIASLLYGTNHSIQEKYLAHLQLKTYRMSLPYIDSIYVYNGASRTLAIGSQHSSGVDIPYETFDRIDPLLRRVLENATIQDLLSPFPHMIRHEESYIPDTFCYTFVVSELYGQEKIKQAVFINFSAGWVQQILKEQADSPSETLMVDAEGNVVFSTREKHIFQNIAGTDLFNSMQQNHLQKQFMVCEIEGEKTVLTLLPQDESGWYYARLTPYNVVRQGSFRSLKLMLTIDVVLLLIYVVLSLIVSKRIYFPIDFMSRQLSDVQGKNQALVVTNQRKRVLRKLLLDASASEQHEELVNEVCQADEELGNSSSYYVLVMRIDKYNRFCNTYPLHERAQRMQLLIEIGMEVLGAGFGIRTLELGEGSNIVFVLTRNEMPQVSRDCWLGYIGQIRQRALEQLSIKFSCALSLQGSHIGELSALYHQAHNALKYRIFPGGGATLFAQDIQAFENKNYAYPEETESRMITCIMNGDGEEARALANEILWGVREQPFISINLTLSKLTMALLMTMRKTEVGNFEFPSEVRETLLVAASLEEIDSFETTVQYFDSAIEQMCASLHDKRDTRHVELAERIHELIDKYYSDPDCNLTFLAQKINMSPSYITRLYRSHTLKTIPDRINEVRMQAARTLLREKSSLSITEISQQTGFSSVSYFSKTFRKEHGMTPNEYRNRIDQGE